MATKARIWPDTPTHPGELLADELMARGVTTAALATHLNRPAADVESILKANEPITADFAWGLESFFGDISARFWMGMQTDYDLGMARLKRMTN